MKRKKRNRVEVSDERDQRILEDLALNHFQESNARSDLKISPRVFARFELPNKVLIHPAPDFDSLPLDNTFGEVDADEDKLWMDAKSVILAVYTAAIDSADDSYFNLYEVVGHPRITAVR